MEIFSAVVIIALLAVVVLRMFRHSRYAIYFHWLETPISTKQWIEMTNEQKADYVFSTMVLALKYYREDPAVWMTGESGLLDQIQPMIQTTDLSAATSLNDATFGRSVRIAMFDTVKQVLSAVKQGKVSGPMLTGQEWLSWPLEKKQSLVADYLTVNGMTFGDKKRWLPGAVSLGYIESIDETAEKHRDDPRLKVFIGNFMKETLRLIIEEFKRKQTEK